ncbi:hypothetical protein BDV93DRAFT_525536, partial [Ceratobasidium sp. AG-I]
MAHRPVGHPGLPAPWFSPLAALLAARRFPHPPPVLSVSSYFYNPYIMASHV